MWLSCSKFLLLWSCINIPVLSLAMGTSIHPVCGLLVESRSTEDIFCKSFTGRFRQVNVLHCCPFLPCAGSDVPAVTWVFWSETLKRLAPNLILWDFSECFCQQGGVCGRGLKEGGISHFRGSKLWAWFGCITATPHPKQGPDCLFSPAAAVLAQVFAALSVLVPGLHIWQLMMWLCLNVCQPKLIISWASNASLLLKGEGPASLFSLLLPVWYTPFPLAALSFVDPPVSLFTVC